MGISTLRFEVPAAELGQTLAILAVGHYGFLLYHKLVPIAGKLDLFGDGVAIKKVKEQHSERFKQEARSIAAFAESVATRIAGGS